MSLRDRIVDCKQGSDEWRAARAGRVTGSRVKDVLAKVKSGEAAARRDYRIQIVTEILTGQPAEQGFTSKEMEWGTEQEPYARAAYEVAKDCVVDVVGFVIHPNDPRAGASPDGLVDWDGENEPEGITQFKCPKSATHVGYILADEVPSEYKPQMTWEMEATGAKWCDFVSFDPRLPDHLQLFVKRFHFDPAYLAEINAEVHAFHRDVDAVLAKLKPAPQPTTNNRSQDTGSAPAPAALERQAQGGGADFGAGEEAVPL